MAWTTPRTWVTGEIVTAALLNAQIKGNMDLSAPAKLTAAGDILYASGANTPARVAKGTNGNILHQASCAPAWTATPSITDLTLSGALDVNGTIDYDGTDVDMLSSGDIDLVSSANAAAAIYIAQSTGTSGTIKISADTGTSVTEGAESINIVSVAGGVGIRSTANLANAINLTVDSGTTSSIAIFNDTGNATGSICLKSDVGGITLNPATFVTVGGNATNAGEVRILEDTDNGSNYVAVKAPNVSTSYTITLPTAVAGGNCYVLTSTTAGVTSWAAAGGGLSSKVMTTSRSGSAGAGTVTIACVGFTPTAVIAFAGEDGADGASWGWADSSATEAQLQQRGSANENRVNTGKIVSVGDGTHMMEAAVGAYSASCCGSFTLVWTKCNDGVTCAAVTLLVLK